MRQNMNPKPKQIGMTPVKSSNINSIGYDADTKTLAVKFDGGGTYHYHNVPADIHLALEMADSAGKYLGEKIKGKYHFTKQ